MPRANIAPADEPASLPPSDTLEPLPEDFWTSSPDGSDAPEPTPPAPPAQATASAAPEPAAPPMAAQRSVAGESIAVLQRLFPGRVLSIDPPPGDARTADGDEPEPKAAEAESDEVHPEAGLESR